MPFIKLSRLASLSLIAFCSVGMSIPWFAHADQERVAEFSNESTYRVLCFYDGAKKCELKVPRDKYDDVKCTFGITTGKHTFRVERSDRRYWQKTVTIRGCEWCDTKIDVFLSDGGVFYRPPLFEDSPKEPWLQ